MLGRIVRALAAASCVALIGASAGCSSSADAEERVAARREELVSAALADMTHRLGDALARARRALASVEAAMDRAPAGTVARFDALAAIQTREGLEGLQYDDPGGSVAWAGVPVEPRDLPDPPAPWAGSFSSGDVVFHSGPFRRAIVVAPKPDRGRSAASVDLDGESRTVGPFGPLAEVRWAEQLGVRAVRVLPPSVLDRPAPAGVRRAPVRESVGPSPAAVRFAVEVEALSDEEILAQFEAEGLRTRGVVGILGLLVASIAAAAALRRWVRSPAARAFALSALPLLVRHGLAILDLRKRFPDLAPAYRTGDFGMTGWHGWLSTPADLLLTCVAVLFAAMGIARAIAHAAAAPGPADAAPDATATPSPPGRRAGSVALGIGLATLGTCLWLFVVDAATFQSKFDIFAPGSLLPSTPRLLLLGSLAAATAAAWTLARAGLRLVVACAAPRVRLACRVAPVVAAVLASLLAILLSSTGLPWWSALLVPLAAVLVGRLRAGALRPGAPSRVLLVSALSTALLFPVLWRSSADAARADLETRISDLVVRPDSTLGILQARVPELAGETEIVRALSAYGGRDSESLSDGLALQAWRRLGFDRGNSDEGAVYVFDRHNRHIDRFGINVPPFHRLPDPAPSADDDDPLTIVYIPWTHEHVGATIARQKLRSTDGTLVGTIAVLVPDALTVELLGLQPRIAALPPGAESERRAGRINLAVVRDGRITQAGEAVPPGELPSIARLAQLRESGWVPPGDGSPAPWLAVPVGPRGIVLARAAPRGVEDVLYGLARVALVGVGVGAIASLFVFLLGVRRFRPRLQDKILWSYFLVSVVPLVFLGYANFQDALARADDDFTSRQREIARTARREIEANTPRGGYDAQRQLTHYAELRGQDFTIFWHGLLTDSSLRSLADAEILPSRLDADVFRATEVEGKDFVVREEWIAGRKVRVAYTPLRDDRDKPSATLSVPLLFDAERAERRAAETASVLLAAYLVALVLLVVLGIYTARGLARRLTALADATRRVAAGELGIALPRSGRDEVGALVDAFNVMTTDLERLREREAAAQRETAWRGMARQVAHEIKNPLTPMKLMLQQLVATARTDPRFAAEMIEPTTKVVLDQIDTLARIASDFSAFARFPPRTLVDVDVNELLRAVALLYAGGEGGAPESARVETDLASDLPAVRWDKDELRRVFVNLVANAVEAVDRNASDAAAQRRTHVVIRSRRGTLPGAPSPAEGVVVSVEDDGVGIAPEHMPRLFQPDFSTKTHGTGLGLAIVKRILADLGGDIRVESELGKGTKVSVALPAAPRPQD